MPLYSLGARNTILTLADFEKSWLQRGTKNNRQRTNEQFGSRNSLMDPSATSIKQPRVQIPSATSWLYLVYKNEIGE